MTRLLLLIGLLALALSGYLFYQNTKLATSNTALENRVSKLEVSSAKPTNLYSQGTSDLKSNCPKSGLIYEHEFLTDYVVKRGDTLLSIAKEQLGSTARVNELVEINKKNYPGLTIQAPFLEKDWVFQIPSGEFKNEKFPIFGMNGEIVGTTGDKLFWVKSTTGVSGGFNLLPDTKVEPEGTKFKVGDCVTYYSQANGELGSFLVRLQTPSN